MGTVKPVYNGHPWDPKIVAVVDRWSLFVDSSLTVVTFKIVNVRKHTLYLK